MRSPRLLHRLALHIVIEIDGREASAGCSLHYFCGFFESFGLSCCHTPFGGYDGGDADGGENGECEGCPAETDVCAADLDLDRVHAHFVDEGGDGTTIVIQMVSICIYI